MPFAILAFLYVVYGASALAMSLVCGIFVVARLAHSVAYLREKQPWRTIFFTIGGLDTIVLIGLLVYSMAVAGVG
jgi:uncharacterized MAPEG superfamily protein